MPALLLDSCICLCFLSACLGWAPSEYLAGRMGGQMDLSLGVEHILKLEVAAFHFVGSRCSLREPCRKGDKNTLFHML